MNKKLLPIIFLLLFSILVSWNIFKPGFFSIHDDLHVMRLYEMKRCFNDGQIPCRWSPDLSYGYGQPVFNYYSATPYYTGSLINLLGFNFLTSTKILMYLSISLAGITMYIFLSQFISTLPALIGGIAYILVPYRALEIFVRGALAENFALALLPLVLYGITNLVNKKDKNSFVLLALFLSLFLTSHNITTLISFPLILFFSITLISLKINRIKNILLLSGSAILGTALASFFLLPVLLESHLVDTSQLTSGYFNFRAHFATLSQLFINQKWGFGASEFGPNDNLSFSVGIVQSMFFVIVPIVIFFRRKTLQNTHKIILGLFWILGIVYLFLTTSRSVGIWEQFSKLAFIQFPWRLLGIVAVCSSIITGFTLDSLQAKSQKTISIGIFIILLLANARYFKFDKYYKSATDSTYLSGQGFVSQQSSAILDYKPRSMKSIPKEVAPSEPQIVSGQIQVSNFQNRSNYFSADIEVLSNEGVVAFPISDFPNWTVYLNHSLQPTLFDTGKYFGEITVTFQKGKNTVQGYLKNTPVRSVSNLITYFSLLLVLLIVFIPNDRKNNQKT